jgi:hypothetical protein
MFPKLPGEYRSRVLRLAMAPQAWERFERLVARVSAPTLPRAYGEVLEQLLENSDSSARVTVRPSSHIRPNTMGEPAQENRGDWQARQMHKERALLAASAPERWRWVFAPEGYLTDEASGGKPC